jgi:hypothetical protein
MDGVLQGPALPIELIGRRRKNLTTGEQCIEIVAKVDRRVTGVLHQTSLTDAESTTDGVLRAVTQMLDFTDLAGSGDLSDLRDEFLHHTHGQAEI